MEKNLIMNLSFTPPTTHSHLFFIHTDLSNFSPKSLLIVQIKFMSIKYVSLHIKKKFHLKASYWEQLITVLDFSNFYLEIMPTVKFYNCRHNRHDNENYLTASLMKGAKIPNRNP